MQDILSRKFSMDILVLICCFHLAISRPAEEPTKFSLNTVNEQSQNVSPYSASRLDQARELIGRIADAIRIGRGRFVNSLILARNIVANLAESLVSDAQNHDASVIPTKPNVRSQGRRSLEVAQETPISYPQSNTRERVRLENETGQALLERPQSKAISTALESFLQPTPLVDGIREEEKYGNSGDKFIGIGRALVGGFEGFSNFLNTILDLPGNAIKNASQGITRTLNGIGARIIGLE